MFQTSGYFNYAANFLSLSNITYHLSKNNLATDSTCVFSAVCLPLNVAVNDSVEVDQLRCEYERIVCLPGFKLHFNDSLLTSLKSHG